MEKIGRKLSFLYRHDLISFQVNLLNGFKSTLLASGFRIIIRQRAAMLLDIFKNSQPIATLTEINEVWLKFHFTERY